MILSSKLYAPLFYLTFRPQSISAPFPYTTLFRSPLRRRRKLGGRGAAGDWIGGDPPVIPRVIADDQFPSSRAEPPEDRKSTRLNSSHLVISYAVFCLK